MTGAPSTCAARGDIRGRCRSASSKLASAASQWVTHSGRAGGSAARACDPAIVRGIRDAAEARGIPLFHKQWRTYTSNPLVGEQHLTIAKAKGVDPPNR